MTGEHEDLTLLIPTVILGRFGSSKEIMADCETAVCIWIKLRQLFCLHLMACQTRHQTATLLNSEVGTGQLWLRW